MAKKDSQTSFYVDLHKYEFRDRLIKNLGEKWLYDISADAFEAIKMMREKGIVHGDLDLHSVILDDSGKIRIIDFDLSIRTTDGYGKDPAMFVYNLMDPLLASPMYDNNIWLLDGSKFLYNFSTIAASLDKLVALNEEALRSIFNQLAKGEFF